MSGQSNGSPTAARVRSASVSVSCFLCSWFLTGHRTLHSIVRRNIIFLTPFLVVRRTGHEGNESASEPVTRQRKEKRKRIQSRKRISERHATRTAPTVCDSLSRKCIVLFPDQKKQSAGSSTRKPLLVRTLFSCGAEERARIISLLEDRQRKSTEAGGQRRSVSR